MNKTCPVCNKKNKVKNEICDNCYHYFENIGQLSLEDKNKYERVINAHKKVWNKIENKLKKHSKLEDEIDTLKENIEKEKEEINKLKQQLNR